MFYALQAWYESHDRISQYREEAGVATMGCVRVGLVRFDTLVYCRYLVMHGESLVHYTKEK